MAKSGNAAPAADCSEAGGLVAGDSARSPMDDSVSPRSSSGGPTNQWDSGSSIAADAMRRPDRLEGIKVELVSVILQQMQRVMQALQEEGAKQTSQIQAMHRAMFVRLEAALPPSEERRCRAASPARPLLPEERRTVAQPAQPPGGSPPALEFRQSVERLDEAGVGEANEVPYESQAMSNDSLYEERAAKRAPDEALSSDSGSEDTELAQLATAARKGPARGTPKQRPSPRGTPQREVSARTTPSRRPGQLPLLPVAKDRSATGRVRANLVAAERRGTAGNDAAGNGSFSDVGQDEASVCGDRVTHGSSYSFQPGVVTSLRGLDDQLTNSLFELHGLMGGGRPSTNRVSFGGDRCSDPQPKRPSVQSSVRSLFWNRPRGEGPSSPVTAESSDGAMTIGRGDASPSTLRLNFTRVHPGAPVEMGRHVAAMGIEGQDEGGTFTSVGAHTDTVYESESVMPVNAGAAPVRGSRLGAIWRVVSGTAPHVLSKRLGKGGGATNMDALRVERESEIIADQVRARKRPAYTQSEEDMQQELSRAHEESKWSIPNIILAVSGIAPADTGKLWCLYRYATFLVVAAVLAGVVLLARDMPVGSGLYFHMSLGCIGFGSFAGIVSLRFQKIHELLGPHERPLEYYACIFGFITKWHNVSRRCSTLVLSMWAFSSICQAVMNLSLGCQQTSQPSLLACGINVLLTGLMYAVIFCKLHICCALELAVDHYCMRFFEDQSPATGIVEWNVMQALLRRAAHVIETCFLSVSTGVLGVIVLTSVEIYNMFSEMTSGDIIGLSASEGVCLGMWSGWVCPPVALMFYFVFRAAAITEKCNRVPALINSWTRMEHLIDHEKQYIVQYIMHSAAGFYVKGVRLNATWALKLLYLFGVLLFSLLTQSVLKNE